MAVETKYVITAEDKTAGAIASATSGLGKLQASASAMTGALSALGGMGGLLGVLGGAGLTASLKSSIDALDQIDETAGRIGVQAESLSALGYAAKMSGVEFDEMTGALTKLSVKMQEAASGDKAAVALFKDLGVSVTDAGGKLKSADALFAEVSDRFAGLEDGAAKTALAVDVFGKSGARLVPLLNQGADGLAAMTAEARAFGAVVDSEVAASAAQFNDNLDRLSTLSSSVAKILVGKLLPSLNAVTERLLAGVKGAGSFGDGISMLLDGTGSAGEQLNKLRRELDDLAAARDRYLKSGADTSSIDTAMATVKRKIDAYKAIQRDEALRGAELLTGVSMSGSKAQVIRTPSDAGGTGKPARAATSAKAAEYVDLETAAWQRLAKAIEASDVEKAKRLTDELAKLDQLAAAGLDPAIVAQIRGDLTGATKEAADETARLNKLLGETPTAQLEAVRADMQLLAAALADGRIGEAQFLEAAQAQVDKFDVSPVADQVSSLDLAVTNAFQGMGDAVADFALGTEAKFSNLVEAMIRDLIRLEIQTQMTSAWKSAGGLSGIASSIGSLFSGGATSAPAADPFTLTANGYGWAKGGVFEDSPSLSSYSGGVYDRPTLFTFAKGAGVFGEAGPEAIMPLKRGPDGKLGVSASGATGNISIVVNNNAGPDTRATANASTDSTGNTQIAVVVERVEGMMGRRIAQGAGLAPLLETRYGLNPAAGARR